MLKIIDKKNEIDKIIGVINIYLCDEFGYDTDNNNMYEIDDLCEELPESVEGMTGASKLAVVPRKNNKDLNIVIKVPFNGCFAIDEDSVEDWDDIVDIESHRYFKPYDSAISYYSGEWDYCKAELQTYQRAVQDGMGDFFAEIEFYKYGNNNHPIYIQEKVQTLSDFIYSKDKNKPEPSNASLAKVRKLPPMTMSEVWLAFAYDYYGEDAVTEFLDYLSMNEITDLHNQNIGFAEGGRPVLLDYSGFFD
jgi:hypothetical protein